MIASKISSDFSYRLLLRADETKAGIDAYLFDSEVYVAKIAQCADPVVVMCLLRHDSETVELMNIAVDEPIYENGAQLVDMIVLTRGLTY